MQLEPNTIKSLGLMSNTHYHTGASIERNALTLHSTIEEATSHNLSLITKDPVLT